MPVPTLPARSDARAAPARDAAARPHVCFVAPYGWLILSGDASVGTIGGAEVQQSILARALAGAGYRVSMICLDFGQRQRARVDGVTVYKVHRPDAGVPGLRFLHPRLTSTWRAMREVDADVYYQRCSSMLTALVAAFCRRHGKRSIFASACDLDFVPGRQPIRYARDRWLFERGLARVDRIVVQNPGQRESCRANYGRDSTLIPGCYEPPASAARGGGEYVLWVGSMRERDFKRPELFLELARRLPHRRCVMIGGPGGDGAHHAWYRGIRDAAAAIPNLEFTGFLPLARAEAYFDRARVLVNTSSHEGMPNTFLQAWARGVPTVAFVDTGARWRGAPLYPVVAGVDAAAAEVERLFVDEARWRRASADCRAYFERTHAVPEVLARFGALLEELTPTVHPDHGGGAPPERVARTLPAGSRRG